MTFLPIVDRELRTAARHSYTYWSRSQAALLALVPTVFLLYVPMGAAPPAQQGASIFQVLTYIAVFYTIMSALRLTADCVSSEKRDGTLGFLFLTDLKPYDVILGKLTGTSLNALYGALASLPVLAIPILMGGVTPADLFRLALVLLNTLFFTLTLSIFVSSVCRDEKKAVGVTTMLLIGFTAGLPLVGNIASGIKGTRSVAAVLGTISPGHACSRITSAAYVAAPGDFWVSTISTHGLAWLFLGLACFVLPRVWQDRPAGKRGLRWREWCQRALMGNLKSRTDFRRRLLDINPIYWIASRERRTVWYPWILLLSLGAIAIITCAIVKVRGVDFATLMFTSVLANWFFKHWVTNQACYAFSVDRDKGALELLLSTPLTVRDMTRGHWMALRRHFLAPVSLLILIESACFGSILLADSPEDGGLMGRSSIAFIAMQVVFLADLVALVWVGWWAGAVSKSASNAVTTAYLRIMIFPWVMTLAGMLVLNIINMSSENDFLMFSLMIWMVICLGVDAFSAIRARRKLFSDLRLAAVERYSGGDPAMIWWRRLGRTMGLWRTASRRNNPGGEFSRGK